MRRDRPTRHDLAVDAPGIRIVAFEWGAEHRAKQPSLLLVHATGFHARCWDPVVSRLPTDLHIVAIDQRGHGGSNGEPPVPWAHFGDDVRSVMEALALDDVVGVGHSMGGYTLTLVAAARPEWFRHLVLVDPVIAAPADYAAGRRNLPPGVDVHPTAKRRRYWVSPDAMFERFHDRIPYSLFTEEALRCYCEHGLVPREDGEGYELACAPEFEASIYMTSRAENRIHDAVSKVRCAVDVIRAMPMPADRTLMDFRYSPTWAGLHEAFADGRDHPQPQRSHFMPMEDPDFIADFLRRAHEEARRR